MPARITAAALIAAALAVALASTPAMACGTVKVFAGVYLGAERTFADKNVSARCQLQMLGSLLCVDKGYLRQPHAKRMLRAALAHAEASGNPRLKCAGEHVARYFTVTLDTKPDTGKPSLEELVGSENRVASFCEADKLHSDEDAVAALPKPGQALRECLVR